MADRSPWIDWSWLKVGPVLPTEKARQEYEAQQPGPQQGPSMSDYQAYRQQMAADAAAQVQRSMAPTGPQWAADNAHANADMAQQIAAPPQPYPSNLDDWSTWQSITGAFSQEGRDAYERAKAERNRVNGKGMDENTPMQTVMPDNVPVPMPRPSIMDENTPAQTVVPDQTPTAPSDDPLEDIRRQKSMIDSIYPQLPPQDIGEDAIDAETQADRQRANYLAQLAFFSGITQSAGGQWEGVGRGLAGAGQAYTSGFDRYQKALQKKADRQQDAANARYKMDVGSTDAAIKLYGADKDREAKALSENRKAIKDRQNDIDEYFKQRLGLAKGNDYTPTDQNQVDQILRDWRISRDRGDIVSSQDVSDK